jgi:flavin reductase
MSDSVEQFKQALSNWASGVTIVTTRDVNDMPKGMTASSFASVSLDPLLVLVCVNQSLYTHQLIEQSGFFAVNILSTDQLEWGQVFAGMKPEIEDRFKQINYTTAQTGAPILPGVPGWVDCRVYRADTAGDHTIFLGEVVAAGGSSTGDPLIYARRQWGKVENLS